MDYTSICDDDFIKEWEQATVYAISVHRKAALKALEEELALPKPPVALDCCELRILKYSDDLCDATPFCELIVQSIPVNKIRVENKQILWQI